MSRLRSFGPLQAGAVVLLLLGPLSLGISSAQEAELATPMTGIWPMLHHDARHTSTTGVVGPATARQFWRYKKWPLFSPSGSAPVVRSDGVIYMADLGHVHAFSRSGQLLWTFTPIGANGWVDSTPAIAQDGTLYVGAWDGQLYAIDNNGKKKWTFATMEDVWVTSSPVIGATGDIYVGGYDGVLYALADQGTYAQEKWRFVTGGNIGSSPALAADGTIYVGSDDGHLYAVNPDGTEKWRFPADGTAQLAYSKVTPSATQPMSPPATMQPSAAVGPDGTVYWDADFGLYALRPGDGSRIWKLDEWAASTPSIGPNGTVYVGLFPEDLIAVNPSSGTVAWRFELTNEVTSSPAIDADGTLYFGCWDFNIYAVDAAGHEVWRWPTEWWVSNSPALDRGTVYFAGDDDYLYALGGPAPGGPDLTGEWTKFTAKTGKKVTATLTVRNLGDKKTGAFKVKVYLSSDDVVDASDKLVKTVAVTPLAAKAKKALAFRRESTTSMSGQLVLAVVDAMSTVSEVDEQNNLVPSPRIR
jgi:outer membrane protein assembly factor BamB